MNKRRITIVIFGGLALGLLLLLSGGMDPWQPEDEKVELGTASEIELQQILEVFYNALQADSWKPESPEAIFTVGDDGLSHWEILWEATGARPSEAVFQDISDVFFNSSYEVEPVFGRGFAVTGTSGLRAKLSWQEDETTVLLTIDSAPFEDTSK